MVEFLAKGVRPGTRMSNGDHALFANAQSTAFAEGLLNLTNYLFPEICGFAICRTFLRSAHLNKTKSLFADVGIIQFPSCQLTQDFLRFLNLSLSSLCVRQVEVLPR